MTRELRVRINVEQLYGVLDAERLNRKLRWGDVATEIGVSPSTLSRMASGKRPDADGLAAIVTWLRLPAELFFDRETQHTSRPHLMTEIAVLLRSRDDIDRDDLDALEQVLRAIGVLWKQPEQENP